MDAATDVLGGRELQREEEAAVKAQPKYKMKRMKAKHRTPRRRAGGGAVADVDKLLFAREIWLQAGKGRAGDVAG